MINCEVYELLSFFANLEEENDIIITAKELNQLENVLREEGVKCDFSRYSLESASNEYPSRFVVEEQRVVIKSQAQGAKKFVYYNSNKEVAQKIVKSWEILIKKS